MTAPRRVDAAGRAVGGALRMELVFEDATLGDQDSLVATMREWIESRHVGRVSIRVAQPPQETVQEATADTSRALENAQVRGEARLVQWTQDGTLVPVSAVEQAWGIKRQSVDAARAQRDLLGVRARAALVPGRGAEASPTTASARHPRFDDPLQQYGVTYSLLVCSGPTGSTEEARSLGHLLSTR